MKIKEASEFTGLSVHTLYQMVHKNSIPYFKISTAVRFSPDELKIWIEKGRPDIMKIGLERLR